VGDWVTDFYDRVDVAAAAHGLRKVRDDHASPALR
jgi:hypothetical protein